MKPWQQIVVAEAQSWLRTPFIPNQCVKGLGVDCARFVASCYELVMGPIAIPSYGSQDYLHTDHETLLHSLEPIMQRTSWREPGYAVTFRLGRWEHAHIAIIEEWPIIITPWDATAVRRIDTRLDPRLNLRRVAAFWEPKEIK